MRVWRQIQDMVRLDGGAPVGQFKPVPASYLQLIDDLVDRGTGRSRRRRGFKRLGAWVATEDWDLLVDDSPGADRIGVAMELLSPAGFLSDRDLVDYEGRDSKQALNDGDRIRYARARLAILAEHWDDSAPSVIAYPIQHSDGTHAFLCGLVRIRGQAGPEVEWHGPFKSLNHYQDSLPDRGLVHEDDLADLTDTQILAAWQHS